MKRLLFDVSRWHLMLHRENRQLPRASDGDTAQARLEDELFERLYTCEGEWVQPGLESTAPLRVWAERVHAACDELPSFARLVSACRGDAAASAAAVEALVQDLKLPAPEEPSPVAPGGFGRDPLRRPLAVACAAAARAVEGLHEALDGLEHVTLVGRQLPGTGTADGVALEHLAVRPLAVRLKLDQRLRRIAALAGRLKRIAAAKRRQRVRHGADEVTDIEQGGDLGRALPVELGKLTHRLLRLDFLRALFERRALQYRLEGAAPLGKGPLVVLLDKSGSMDGPRDVWATAVGLALLDQAQAERRAFALLGFDARVKFEAVVQPRDALPEEGLFVSCCGGTDIAAAVARGIEIIRTHPGALCKADIVLVTDGGSDASAAGVLREGAAALGITIFGLGIGVEREWLAPWCDEVHVVTNLSTIDDASATALFAA